MVEQANLRSELVLSFLIAKGLGYVLELQVDIFTTSLKGKNKCLGIGIFLLFPSASSNGA